MKKLFLFSLTTIIITSCGGSSGGSKNSPDVIVLERQRLENEVRIPIEDVAKELEESFANQLNELYIDQSFLIQSNRTEPVIDITANKTIECHFETVEKSTVIDFDEIEVKIYVEKNEKTSNNGCVNYLQNGKSLKVYKRKPLFHHGFSKKELQNVEIYRGFRDGQVMYSLAGTINPNIHSENKTDHYLSKIAVLFNPNVSNLYATEFLQTKTANNGTVFHSETSSRVKIDDIDADSLDLDGVPTIHVTKRKKFQSKLSHLHRSFIN